MPDLEQVGHHHLLLADGQVVGVAELLDAGDLRAALLLLGREGEQRVVDGLRDEAAGGEGVGRVALGEDRELDDVGDALGRDEGRFLSGRKLSSPPQVFLGAAVNPFVPPLDYRPTHFAKKVAAGAEFVQTQYCYDVPLLRRFMDRAREQGLHEQCFILVGVGPLASAKTARWMRSSVPGVHIPDAVAERIERAGPPKEQKAEGKRLCVELIQEIREIPGVHGVHIMAYRQEEFVSDIIQASGVLQVLPALQGAGRQRGNKGMTETVVSSATRTVVIGFDRPFLHHRRAHQPDRQEEAPRPRWRPATSRPSRRIHAGPRS